MSEAAARIASRTMISAAASYTFFAVLAPFSASSSWLSIHDNVTPAALLYALYISSLRRMLCLHAS